ncbi:DOPA 4,5-dioxygenase family protein [Azorhizophilus paspali]|uniref:DOPA 4,5-dioxygenase family protein n=1 Tax=Azorhizophilus paspali TaxID=69963 RepID=UPI00362FC6A6
MQAKALRAAGPDARRPVEHHSRGRASPRGLYQCHVYFEKEDRLGAAALRDRVIGEPDCIVDISPLIFERVGPHTMPMFEIDIEPASVDAAVAWLDANRGGFSVLVHPVPED